MKGDSDREYALEDFGAASSDLVTEAAEKTDRPRPDDALPAHASASSRVRAASLPP
jgi:hypothetical protein